MLSRDLSATLTCSILKTLELARPRSWVLARVPAPTMPITLKSRLARYLAAKAPVALVLMLVRWVPRPHDSDGHPSLRIV